MQKTTQAPPEKDLFKFNLDDLALANVTVVTDVPKGAPVSRATHATGTTRLSWCSDNTSTCTWAECCDGTTIE